MDEFILQPILKPIITIVDNEKIHKNLLVLISEGPQYEMDYEIVNFSYTFKARNEMKNFPSKPQGILHKSWSFNLQKKIPAVLLLVFYANDPIIQWKNYESVILTEIQKYRNQCKGIALKIAVLCVYPSEENTNDKKKGIKKFGKCNKKAILFIKNFHELKSAQKFKKYLYEASIRHYKTESERLKILKSKIKLFNKTDFSELKLRYTFKLGVLSELRSEKETSAKYYRKVYQEIIRYFGDSPEKEAELQGFADLVLHRILCGLASKSDLEKFTKAFTNHLKTFRRIGGELSKLKWVTQQYFRFGELLALIDQEKIISHDLWSHFGYYFLAICNLFVYRMKISVQNNEFMQSVTNWNNFIIKNNLQIIESKFVGQFRYFFSDNNQEIIEGLTRNEQEKIINDIQESKTQHLSHAVDFAFKALKFYNTNISMPRMSIYIVFVLANLFKIKGDFSSSYRSFTEIKLKCNDWEKIQRYLLKELLEDSVKIGKPNENVRWSLEWIDEISEERLIKTFEKINENFEVKSGITAKCFFQKKIFFPYEDVKFKILIQSSLKIEIKCEIEIIISEKNYSQIMKSVNIVPGKNIFEFSFFLDKIFDCLRLEFVNVYFWPNEKYYIKFENEISKKIKILPPKPKIFIGITHSGSGFINNHYKITGKLESSDTLQDVFIEFFESTNTLTEENCENSPSLVKSISNSRHSPFSTSFLGNFMILHKEKEFSENQKILLSNIPSIESFEMVFKSANTFELTTKVHYTVKINDFCYSLQEELFFKVNITSPIIFSCSLKSDSQHTNNYLEVNFTSDFPNAIKILKTQLTENQISSIFPESFFNYLIEKGETITTLFQLNSKFNYFDSEILCVVDYITDFEGKLCEKKPNSLSFPLKISEFLIEPMHAYYETQSQCKIFEPFTAEFVIINKDQEIIEVEFWIDDDDHFYVDGLVHKTIEILPKCSKKFLLYITGVEYGCFPLPSIRLNYNKTEKICKPKPILIN